jgi:DNA-binding transcriptional MerR regulator/methylmalonyl-CoA mutase cobalamin-binding subunit
MKRRRPHDALPMRTVARLTGLSPDIIRAWEKRYHVVAPERGPRGARLYTSANVRHLRLLAQVVASGRAIGDVAALSTDDLDALLAPPAEPSPQGRAPSSPAAAAVAEILLAIDRFEASEVERRLGDALLACGDRSFVREVAAPLLDAVGNQWAAGRLPVAAEHLASSALRNLLGGLIRNRGRSQAATVLLATPSGEPHELGILMVALLLRAAGVGVSYLGPDLPAAEILGAAQRAGAAVVGIGVVDGGNAPRAVQELRAIDAGLPNGTELWVGGRAAAAACDALGHRRPRLLDDLNALEMEIARLRSASAGSH